MAKKSQLLPKLILVGLTLILLGGFFALGTRVTRAEEGSFTTLAAPVDNLPPVSPPPAGGGSPAGNSGSVAISEEVASGAPMVAGALIQASGETSFTTLVGGLILPSLVISGEISATSGSLGGGWNPQLVISSEVSATTSSGGGGGGNPLVVVSSEVSVTTVTPGGPPGNAQLVISAEVGISTVTPAVPPTPPGGGCVSNCGSSGSTSGGGGYIFPPNLPRSCPLYLTEYIKEGATNNPWEVLKLQLFLHGLEGERDLQLTGVYDAPTVAAVRRFQLRYGADVLGPWGIAESTGYVFITTRLAINNIYCERSTANSLDLRNYYPAPAPGAPAIPLSEMGQLPGTSHFAATPVVAPSAASWSALLAALGALGPSLSFWVALLIFLILLLLALVLTRHWGELGPWELTKTEPEASPPDELITEDQVLSHEDEVVVEESEISKTEEETARVRVLPIDKTDVSD